jgi:TM2 domain-containing membrane protein YozV
VHSEPARNPGLAAILSFILPGAGQIYTGNFGWAIIWLIITPGLWLGSGGFLGWVAHILAAAQSHKQAERRNYRLLV